MSRGILDFSMRYSPASNRWGVTAYVNNLTDELNMFSVTYNADPAAAAGTYGHTTGFVGEPRTFGAFFDVKF